MRQRAADLHASLETDRQVGSQTVRLLSELQQVQDRVGALTCLFLAERGARCSECIGYEPTPLANVDGNHQVLDDGETPEQVEVLKRARDAEQ